MKIEIHTFGFKYGTPPDTDMIFDVRFLTNPFYIDGLRELTGLDKPVSDYVFGFENSREFLDRLYGLFDFLVPQFESAGRECLTAAIGCTGGKHRSVSIAEKLAAHLGADIVHRDIGRH